MLGYTTVGTRDIAAARAFYTAVLAPLAATVLYENDREIYWGRDAASPKFAVVLPFDGEPATAANGSMVAIRAESREQVAQAHAAAIRSGASDEGAVGPRGEGPFYGGYFRDLDGHKICVFTT
ncbi:MAG: VOC family protein [Nannocystaceae bacterium]|nr:VOC family protein [Nannocystaceae bacterium]